MGQAQDVQGVFQKAVLSTANGLRLILTFLRSDCHNLDSDASSCYRFDDARLRL